MNIKELAYSAQQHLLTCTGNTFKRSHVYELLAAAYGFNTYAAFSSQAVFTQQRSEENRPLQHVADIRERGVALGLASVADAISSELPVFLADHQIDVVKIPDLVSALRDDYDDWGGHPEWDEEFPPILLEGLEVAAAKGNALAHVALALIHTPGEDEEVGSSHWYLQERKGRVLTGVEKEWADAYAHKLLNAEKHAFHLREAARLGNADALLGLAEYFDDPSFFEHDHGPVTHDPMQVAEIAEQLGRTVDVQRWLTIAAKDGDTDAMRRLIEEFDHEDLSRCWQWLYLAQLLGTDLTRNAYYAINEDGSPYDDDVGGPAFVDGVDGVELAPLNAQEDAIARRAAEELYSRLEQDK